jgi:hypothetical protein
MFYGSSPAWSADGFRNGFKAITRKLRQCEYFKKILRFMAELIGNLRTQMSCCLVTMRAHL